MNDFGGHIGMILLLLFILFQYSFQIMRSLCQEECEADVSIILRSRCQNGCEADARMNACANNLVLEQITGTHSSLPISERINAKPMSG